MTETQSATDYCQQEVREHDLDRYYCCLFSPTDERRALFALLAFNQEVTKTRSVVSEPMLGEIRLQWWREALEEIEQGRPRAHPVVEALAGVDGVSGLFPYLNRIIDGWTDDLHPTQQTGISYLETLARSTGGALHQALLLAQAPQASDILLEAAEQAGTAWSLLASVRGLDAEIRNGSMPELEELGKEALQDRLKSVVTDVCAKSKALLSSSQTVAGRNRPVSLAVNGLTRLHLKAVQKADCIPAQYAIHRPSNLATLWSIIKYNVVG